MSILCQKEKCKELHFMNTMNLLKQIDKLGLEIGKLSREKWTLEQKYKELKTNYRRLNKAHQKIKENKKFSYFKAWKGLKNELI